MTELNDINKLNNKNDCSICLDKISTDYNFTITKCGHWFHTNCITSYYINNTNEINLSCPCCRNKNIIKKPVIKGFKTFDDFLKHYNITDFDKDKINELCINVNN